jgi:CspA family cold shock protein
MHIPPPKAPDLPSAFPGPRPAPGIRPERRFNSEKSMAIGTVKWFNSQKGYGFIQPKDGSRDVFVHISAVERAGLGSLQEGQQINYDIEQGQQGKSSAVNLRSA